MNNTSLISIREYGRRRGCSDTAVRKAIKAGKIVDGVVRDKKGNVLGIDEAVANNEWALNHDPSILRVTQNGQSSERFVEASTKAEAPKPLAAGGGSVSSDNSLAAAKRARAIYEAKLKELEYKERSGELVDKKEVYKALYGAGQELRQAFQAIPDRFIDDILAAKSRNEAHQILSNAIADTLECLSEIQSRDITTNR